MTLLPCPFCGGKAEIFQGANKNEHTIRCTCCAVKMPIQLNKNDAAAAWNRRVSDGWLVPQMCTADDLKTDLPLPRTYSTKGSDSDA